jgi:hypothetical protein
MSYEQTDFSQAFLGGHAFLQNLGLHLFPFGTTLHAPSLSSQTGVRQFKSNPFLTAQAWQSRFFLHCASGGHLEQTV